MRGEFVPVQESISRSIRQAEQRVECKLARNMRLVGWREPNH